MASTLYRARVVRLDTTGVYVEIAELGSGVEWGPLELVSMNLSLGDSVIVGSIGDVAEDMILLGVLTTGVPIPGSSILFFENQAARTASGITPISGLATWLDDEQRLEIYTDEGIPGWVAHYGAKFDQILYPAPLKIGVGTTTPDAVLDIVTASFSDPILMGRETGDVSYLFRLSADGMLIWGDGTSGDTEMFRDASGSLQINTRLGIDTSPDVLNRLELRNTQATERGLFIESTASSQTGAHIYVLSNSGSSTGPSFSNRITGESVERFTVLNNGQLQWSDGATAADITMVRSSSGPGLHVSPRLSAGGAPASTATVTARQSTNRVGFFSNNTETSVTHSLAHFYAIEAGNSDSRLIAGYMSGESFPRINAEVGGKVSWGGGSGAADVTLHRSAASSLTLTGNLSITGNLAVTGVGNKQLLVLPSGQTSTNSTTYVTVTSSTVTLAANSTYWLMLRVAYQAELAADIKFHWLASDTVNTFVDRNILAPAPAATGSNVAITEMTMIRHVAATDRQSGGFGAGSPFTGYWEDCYITNSAGSAQTIDLQFAQFAANATATTFKGGYIVVERFA